MLHLSAAALARTGSEQVRTCASSHVDVLVYLFSTLVHSKPWPAVLCPRLERERLSRAGLSHNKTTAT